MLDWQVCEGEAVSSHQDGGAVSVLVSSRRSVPAAAQHRAASVHCGDHSHPVPLVGPGGQKCSSPAVY